MAADQQTWQDKYTNTMTTTDPKSQLYNTTLIEARSYGERMKAQVESAVKELAALRGHLLGIARILCAEQIDGLMMELSCTSQEELPIDRVVALVKGTARIMNLAVSAASQDSVTNNRELIARIAELEVQVASQTKRAMEWQRRFELSQRSNKAERSQAVAVIVPQKTSTQPDGKSAPPKSESLPENRPVFDDAVWVAWLSEYQGSEGYTDVCTVIKVVGQTGLTHRNAVIEKCIAIAGRAETTWRVYHIPRAVKEGLLSEGDAEIPATSSSKGGRRAINIELTKKGVWFYKKVTGLDPVPSQESVLLAAHKDGHHAALILDVEKVFRRLNYETKTPPVPLPLDGNRRYQADLFAQKKMALLIEVETKAHLAKSSSTFTRKWADAFDATGGIICVIAEGNKGNMNTATSSVRMWAQQTGKYPVLYATYTDYLWNVQEGQSPWARIENLDPTRRGTLQDEDLG
jgi:hypothetical protein